MIHSLCSTLVVKLMSVLNCSYRAHTQIPSLFHRRPALWALNRTEILFFPLEQTMMIKKLIPLSLQSVPWIPFWYIIKYFNRVGYVTHVFWENRKHRETLLLCGWTKSESRFGLHMGVSGELSRMLMPGSSSGDFDLIGLGWVWHWTFSVWPVLRTELI